MLQGGYVQPSVNPADFKRQFRKVTRTDLHVVLCNVSKCKYSVRPAVHISRVTIVCTATPDYCSLLVTFRNVISSQAPSRKRHTTASIIHRSLQDCGSSLSNLLHVIFLAHRFCRGLIDFWESCGPLRHTHLSVCRKTIIRFSTRRHPASYLLELHVLQMWHTLFY